MMRVIRCSAGVLLAVWLLSVYLCSDSKTPEPEPKPLVQIDLRQFGYLHPVAERDQWSYELLSDPVLFLDSDHLVASYLVSNPKPGLSERDHPFGSPILFHSTDFDLTTGKPVWSRSWGNDSNSEALLALSGGNLLVQSSDLLSVLDSSLKPIVRRHLEYAGDTLAQPFISATGNTLYLVQPTSPQSAIAVMDPVHLRVLKEYAVPKVVTFSGSDEYIAYSVEEGYFGSMSMRVQSLSGKAPNISFTKYSCYGYSPTFLSMSTMIVSGGCENFTFVDLEKQEIWQQKLPKASGTELRVARHANRFAFELVEHHGDRPSTPIEVDVFDLNKRDVVFKLKIANTGQRFSFALSPDGKRLAVLQSPMVSVYEVPE